MTEEQGVKLKRLKRRNKIFKLSLIILALIGIWLIFDIYVKFDESGNRVSKVGFRINPMDYVIEYKYVNGKKIGKAVRHKNKLELVYFDSLGVKTQIVEENIGAYPAKRTHFYKNGNIKSIAQIKDSLKDGNLMLYGEDGTLIEERLYKNDHLLIKSSKNSHSYEYYPYIEAILNEEENLITFRVDLDHIDLSNDSTIYLYYDFAKDTMSFYATRFKELINNSEVDLEFRKNSLDDFQLIYGFLEIDSVIQPTFSKRIKRITIKN